MKAESSLKLASLLVVILCILTIISSPLMAVGQAPTQSRQLQQPPAVNAWPSKAKRWALVIGVDQYRDENISPLKGAENDAAMLAQALVQHAGFPSDQIILLTTNQPQQRQPTRINILTYLSNLASLVPKDGLLLVSFAGHGIERGGQAYLIPSDARLTDDISLLEDSAISVARMRERIRAIGVGQVVVFLDACRNDPGGRADAPNPLTQAYVRAFNFDVRNREVTAFATLYATAVGQRAYEYTEKKQGYFTWAIIEGLKGGAANGTGEVTLASLVKYVQEIVPKRVAIDLGGSKQQRPFYQIEGYKAEELVIAISVTTPMAAMSNTPPPSIDPAAIELSYWETIRNSSDPEDFKAYLEKYPNGQFASIAKRRASPVATDAKAFPEPNNSTTTKSEENLPWGWSKLTYDEGHFRILAPGRPEEIGETSNSQHGPYTTHLFRSKTPNAIYIFGWVDYDPKFNFNVQGELNANRDNFLKGVKGKLLSESNITLNGHPGIEFTAESPQAFFKSRVYIIGRRPYQLIVAIPTGKNDDEGIKTFFASFEITNVR